MKKLKKITPEEVTKKLVELVDTRYGGDRKPLAQIHGVDEFYLWLFISGRRMPPDWLLKELNVVKKRRMIYEYYELVDDLDSGNGPDDLNNPGKVSYDAAYEKAKKDQPDEGEDDKDKVTLPKWF